MNSTTPRRIHRSAPITAGPTIDHPTRLDLAPRTFYAPDDGQGNGSAGDPDGSAQQPTQTPAGGGAPIDRWIIPDEHRPGLIRRIEEAGSIESAIQTLWRDAYDAREARRQAGAERDAAREEADRLRQQLAEATTNPDGGRRITAEEAAALEAYSALGAPAELAQRLDQATQAAQRLEQLTRMETIRTAAQAVGYDPDILADRLGDLELRIEETTQDGEPLTLVQIVDPGQEDSAPVSLTEYAAQNWSRYLPVLEAQQAQETPGAPYPRQRPAPTAAGQGQRSIADQWFAQEEARKAGRPNPLLQPKKEPQ